MSVHELNVIDGSVFAQLVSLIIDVMPSGYMIPQKMMKCQQSQKRGITEYVEEEDGKDLDRDQTIEDFIPIKDVDEEKDEELPQDREEKILADEDIHVIVDVKDLVRVGK